MSHAPTRPGYRRPMSAIVVLLATALFTLVACSPDPKTGDPALPVGFTENGVPTDDLRGFAYFNTGTPVLVSAETFGEETADLGDLAVHRLMAALRHPSSEYAVRVELADADTASQLYQAASSSNPERWAMAQGQFFMTGRPEGGVWSERIQSGWTTDQPRTLEDAYPGAWNNMRLLPEQPPASPFAAGFVRDVSQVINDLLSRADIRVPGLDSSLNLMRVDSISFAAYADDLDRLPTSPSRQALRDSETSVLAVATSSYPGFVVGFLFPRFADRTGLEQAEVDGKTVLYRALDDDLHLMLRNQGASFFFALSPTRSGAEDLIRSVITSQDSR